jgi:Acetyltransferases
MSQISEVLFATAKDIPMWMNLVKLVKDNFPGLEIDSYTNTLKKNIERKTALCVKQGKLITGVLLFSPNKSCISCMAVHPGYRGLGIAMSLIEKMLSLLPPDKDVTVTTFRSDDEKGIAPRALYKKFGFEEAELFYEFDYPVQKFLLHRHTLVIHIATKADIDSLFVSNEEFNGKNCTTKELNEKSITANDQEIVCIAYIGDTAAGFICGQLFKSMCYAVNYAEITELYVREEYRRQGIATRLMGYMEHILETKNIKEFQLFTGKENISAQVFYEKLGYKKTDELMYRKRL